MNFRNEHWLKAFGKNLCRIREDAGFTQEKLAYDSGLTLSQIARIELGKTNPTLCTIVVLEKTLGVAPGTLMNMKFK